MFSNNKTVQPTLLDAIDYSNEHLIKFKDYVNLSLVSKANYLLFHPKTNARKLLRAINLHQYDEVKTLVVNNPEHIFIPMEIKLADFSIQNISAIGLAIYLLDLDMYDLLLSLTSPDSLEIFLAQAKFYEENVFNITNLINSYNKFNGCLTKIETSIFYQPSFIELAASWLDIGRQQKRLPLPFLNEFCRQINLIKSNFEEQPLTAAKVKYGNNFINLDEKVINNLGALYTLARIKAGTQVKPVKALRESQKTKDHEIFIRLHAKRHLQIKNRIAVLENKLTNNCTAVVVRRS